jgi:hypothetical protein
VAMSQPSQGKVSTASWLSSPSEHIFSAICGDLDSFDFRFTCNLPAID